MLPGYILHIQYPREGWGVYDRVYRVCSGPWGRIGGENAPCVVCVILLAAREPDRSGLRNCIAAQEMHALVAVVVNWSATGSGTGLHNGPHMHW